MKYALVTPDSPGWYETIEKMSFDFYHLPQYLALNARFEEGEAYAFMAEEGSNIFFFPFIVRPISLTSSDTRNEVFNEVFYDAVSPYGYSCPLLLVGDAATDFYDKALNTFLDELKRRNVISVFSRLHPVLTTYEKLKYYGTLVFHGSTVSIDLNLSEQEIWCQMRRNHRNGIKRAQKLGYSFALDYDWQYWDMFLSIYYETMNRAEAEQYYYFNPQYFEDLKQDMGSCLHLGIVFYKDEVASAGLFTEVNGIVQYHFSATADKYLNSGSSKALLYYMILWEKQRGNRIMHIGGGVGGQEDSLFRFKMGFSETRHPFYTWRIISNPEIYSEVVNEWERQKNGEKADDIYGFFPAYRKGIASFNKSGIITTGFD